MIMDSVKGGVCRMTTLALLMMLSCPMQAKSQGESQEQLRQLWADYQAYGLPAPPAGTYVARLPEPGMYVTNGVRHQDIYLVLVVKKGATPRQTEYWVGCAPGPERHRSAVELEKVSTDAKALAGTTPLSSSFCSYQGFPTYPDLALAVQAHACGWPELAAALLERHRRDSPRSRRARTPADPRAALAELAWNYWCNQFTEERGDRRPIVERLRQISTGPFGFDQPAHRNVLADMEATLKPSAAAPGSLEEALDRLTDLKTDGSWPARDLSLFHTDAESNEHYKKLSAAGLDAVPLLLKHLDDFRLTRCQAVTDDYHWHIRIADVVAQRLRQLAGKELRYDFLQRAGRGVRADVGYARAWAASVAKQEERQFLLGKVFKPSSYGEDKLEADEAILTVLARKYPDDFLKLWHQHIGQEDHVHAFVAAMQEAKLPVAKREELLLAAARSEDPSVRYAAGLALKDGPEATALVIAWLEQLPKTPKEGDGVTPARLYARVASRFNDDRVWTTLAKTAKRVDLRQRLEIVDKVGDSQHRDRQVAFLRQFLEDQDVRSPAREDFSDGLVAGFVFDRIKVGDFAAMELGRALAVASEPDPNWSEAEWKTHHAKVADALKQYDAARPGKEKRP
jgi:hypothetical protein